LTTHWKIVNLKISDNAVITKWKFGDEKDSFAVHSEQDIA